MDQDEAAAADRWRKANLLSGAIARAAKSNKPLIISALQAWPSTAYGRVVVVCLLCYVRLLVTTNVSFHVSIFLTVGFIQTCRRLQALRTLLKQMWPRVVSHGCPH
jgi:hypothetical protein